MYPKDYILQKKYLIELWISHGYIEPKGKRRITEIGAEYYEELKERSFLDDCSDQSSECCKLNDIIHDFARLISKSEHYSVEINQPLDIQKGNFPLEAYHLFVQDFVGYVNQILEQNQQKMKGLRTLSMDLRGGGDLEHEYCINNGHMLSEYHNKCWETMAIGDLTKFEALRVLELKGSRLIKIPDSISKLKHLAYLSITSSCLKTLPLSIGLLYNLQTLILICPFLEYLPDIIGDLSNLRRLVIRCNNALQEVPLDLRNLYNLHGLTICSNQIEALPNTIGCLSSLEELNLLHDELEFHKGRLDYDSHGLVNFPAIKTMKAWLRVRTIAWLKDMKDLEGKLSIEGLEMMSNLADARLANLSNKCKLEMLDLCWDSGNYKLPYDAKSKLILRLTKIYEGELVGADDVDSFSLLECLQPHSNLKKFLVRWYPSATVPKWMRDPSSFCSIQEISLEYCVNIQSLPFNNLHTLKHLKIQACSSIRVLQLEQLSIQLEKLQILECDHLELITGLGDLDMLVELKIISCKALKSLKMDGLQLGESTEPFGDSSHEMPHIVRQSISSLKKLEIEDCDLLHVLPDGLIPSGCDVRVRGFGCRDI